MSYLLDTNICIHLFKGHDGLVSKLDSVGLNSCYLSEITILELMFGVENSAASRRSANRDNLDWLRAAFSGRILLVGECFEEYARQKVALRQAGLPTGEFDLLIGSTAVSGDLTLVTRNTRDFRNLANIRLENWVD
ncbi:MAG: VapC toxin family PIN domain ribonuclease [Dyadobacter sp. 50-39]|uniref:PIN domain-containing protein n=1 Tax=Dyadobacter sp. 50-39 TaxID=1895756 RepID=UPI00095CF3DD|nr:PIN domain-containing protein [Dyadobacter sp. 50-39]OJV20032.1 MAG: VapC toxin family PIN domain ribonuclease [Dyadobacter sp. 50-39]